MGYFNMQPTSITMISDELSPHPSEVLPACLFSLHYGDGENLNSNSGCAILS